MFKTIQDFYNLSLAFFILLQTIHYSQEKTDLTFTFIRLFFIPLQKIKTDNF